MNSINCIPANPNNLLFLFPLVGSCFDFMITIHLSNGLYKSIQHYQHLLQNQSELPFSKTKNKDPLTFTPQPSRTMFQKKKSSFYQCSFVFDQSISFYTSIDHLLAVVYHFFPSTMRNTFSCRLCTLW